MKGPASASRSTRSTCAPTRSRKAPPGIDLSLLGEAWLPDAARLARYVNPGEPHTVFNFPYLSCPWDAVSPHRVIDETLALGAPATWVRSNHDVDRIVTRYGRADTWFHLDRRRYFHDFPVDLTLGTRVPLPWSGTEPPFGFSPGGAAVEPWLPSRRSGVKTFD